MAANEPLSVPRVSFIPGDSLAQDLEHLIAPLQHVSLDVEKQAYKRTIETIGQHLLQGCVNCVSQMCILIFIDGVKHDWTMLRECITT